MKRVTLNGVEFELYEEEYVALAKYFRAERNRLKRINKNQRKKTELAS